jgi:hypothetical protein
VTKTRLLDLSDKVCKFPIGHPDQPDFHFCGEPSHPGFPYCVTHCAVVYETREARAANTKAYWDAQRRRRAGAAAGLSRDEASR